MLCVKKPHWMVSLITVTMTLLSTGLCLAQGQADPTDYIAELNKLGIAGRPESDNAAPYYQKAIELYVKKPTDLTISTRSWPKEQPAQEQAVLRKWVQDNNAALEQIQLGSQKSYCWFTQTDQKLQANPSLTKIRDLAMALQARAMLQAEDGGVSGAVNDIVTLYRFGAHIAEGPKLIIEKLVGIGVRSFAIRAAFNILSEKMVNADLMKNLQNQLGQLLTKQNEPFDFSGEKLYMQGQIETDPNSLPLKPYLKSTFEYYDTMAAKTPWQLHNEQTPSTTMRNPLIETTGAGIVRVVEIEYRSRTDTQALITTLAILRYKSDKGIYPASLPELVPAGYIKELPTDPFSNNPLVYKQTRESFTLYSFGVDYDDDGGQPSKWGSGDEGGDQVFWPLEPTPILADEGLYGRRGQTEGPARQPPAYQGFEGQAQPGSSLAVIPRTSEEILADANEIKARVKTYEGLAESLEEVESKSRLEKSAWAQRRIDNRTSLIRVVEEQVKLEMTFVRKIAAEEKAEKTIKTIDDVLSSRDDISGKVRKELLAQRREARQSQQQEVSRGRGMRGSRGTRGRNLQEGYQQGYGGTAGPGQEIRREGGYGRRGEPDEGEQLDSETQNKISQWLQTTLDNKETLMQFVYTDVRAQYALIQAVAAEEEAKKTTAAIDGILLSREERFEDIVLRMEELAEREQQMQDGRGRNLRTRGRAGQDWSQPGQGGESVPRSRRR